MTLTCPECGGVIFLRAMRRVRFVEHWLPWLAPREVLVGYLARCEECHCDVKLERSTVKRLRMPQPVAQAPPPPAEEPRKKPGIEPYATPTQVWDRGTR